MDAQAEGREQNEVLAQLGRRTTHVAVASLAVVVFIMAVSLFVLVQLAESSRDDAASLETVNDDLRTELNCRSAANSKVLILQVDMQVLTARALVGLSRDEPIDGFVTDLEATAAELEVAAAEQRRSVETCKVDD